MAAKPKPRKPPKSRKPRPKPRTREERLRVKRDQERERRRVLISHGICTRCARASSVEGKRQCQPCLDYSLELTMRRYRERKDQALCATCGKAPVARSYGASKPRSPRAKRWDGRRVQCERCRQNANRISMRSWFYRRIEWIEPID